MNWSVDASTSLVVDALRIPLRLLFAAPALVSVLLQCQLLPAQVAESVFVYHHGKLSSSPAIFQCSVSDHILPFKALSGHPAACVGGHTARKLPAHPPSLSAKRGLKRNSSITSTSFYLPPYSTESRKALLSHRWSILCILKVTMLFFSLYE